LKEQGWDFGIQFLQFMWSKKQITLVIQMYRFAAEKQSVILVHTVERRHNSITGPHSDQSMQAVIIIILSPAFLSFPLMPDHIS
jgi:hypothetical protein